MLGIMKKLLSWFRAGKSADTQAVPDMASSPRPPGPIPDLQIELTQLALRVAEESFGKKLDFSHDSIKMVESILAEFHREYEKSKSEEGLNGIALEFGAYIATTIQRNTGEGVLERDHSEFGEAAFPFHYSGGTIFPYMWCVKRIFDGEGDNVWSKYRVLVLEPQKRQ
jgi:hypothetical protein